MVIAKYEGTDYLKFHAARSITNLFKNYLALFEVLEERGYRFGEEDYKFVRKKILDYGNNTIRELNGEIDKFDILLRGIENSKES